MRKNEELKKGIEDIMNEANIYIPGVKEFQEGKQEGRIELLIDLVNDGILEPGQAAAKAGLTEEAFKKMTGNHRH